MARSREPVSRPAKSSVAPARPTRELLVELAAEAFATEGYAAASVRDLSRRLGVTSGALYGNFRGKADLLAEAVDARLTTDMWSLPEEIAAQRLVDVVAYQFEHYKSREQLMSLILEGALAARADPDVKRRLHDTIGRRLKDSSRAFESRREAEGFDPGVDLDAVVKVLWSIEIGLRALSALGFAPPAQQDCADVVGRFLQGLQAGPAPARPVKRVKPVKKAPAERAAKQAPAAPKAASKASARRRSG